MKYKYKEIIFSNFKWIDICNPEKEDLDKISKDYNLDYFQIKDSLETGHLPKFEQQENYNFLILRAFTAKIDDRITNIGELSNKIAFFFNDKKVITIHRSNFNFLENFDVKPLNSEDLVIYFIHKMMQTFEEPCKVLGEKNDEIEQKIFLNDSRKISLEDLFYQKTQTRISKKLLQISQNVIQQIEVSEKSKTALQDIKDRQLSLILRYDEALENLNSLLHSYLSINAQKSNDVTKLLTIFSAFFLPLTFVAGIYGMNFEFMPELKWQKGYFFTLGLMVIISLCIYLWFKRKRII